MLLAITEKMEYEKQLQELRQQYALQAERFEAHLSAADQRTVELVKNEDHQIGRDDNAVQELEMMLEKERSKLSGNANIISGKMSKVTLFSKSSQVCK